MGSAIRTTSAPAPSGSSGQVDMQDHPLAFVRDIMDGLGLRVFALDIATCPSCHRGALRLIAVITQGEVIRTILRHLKLAADPPPLTPARARQATFGWVAEKAISIS